MAFRSEVSDKAAAMSAIVFAVRAGAGKLSGGRPVGQIPVQMVIQEFGTIVR